ncbi:MAG: delta-60 repeat domain-containing protein, partial [Betaproteobacteria bacterium]
MLQAWRSKPWRLLWVILLALVLLLLWAPQPAAAQSALDGFDPNANDVVLSVVVQTDGKVLLGGGFTLLGSQTRNRIARLNADGSVDASFDPNADGAVNTLALQPDGKILVGG